VTAIADDLNPIALGGRAHEQRDRFAGAIRIAIRIAPDFATGSVHAGLFVIVAENGPTPLLMGETEIRETVACHDRFLVFAARTCRAGLIIVRPCLMP
jgi:hypothetical protein